MNNAASYSAAFRFTMIAHRRRFSDDGAWLAFVREMAIRAFGAHDAERAVAHLSAWATNGGK